MSAETDVVDAARIALVSYDAIGFINGEAQARIDHSMGMERLRLRLRDYDKPKDSADNALTNTEIWQRAQAIRAKWQTGDPSELSPEVRAIMDADWTNNEDSVVSGSEVFGTVTDNFGPEVDAELAAAIVAEHQAHKALVEAGVGLMQTILYKNQPELMDEMARRCAALVTALRATGVDPEKWAV